MTTKDWASNRGRHHTGKPFTKVALLATLRNVLYIGSIIHKGEVFRGEHEAIVQKEVWEAAQRNLSIAPVRKRKRGNAKQSGLLTGLLRCATCRRPMVPSYTTRHGHKYTYYTCDSKREHACGKARVERRDIETSLHRHLEPILGNDISRPVLEGAVDQVIYDQSSGLIRILLRDGTQSEYKLVLVARRGKRAAGPTSGIGRVPRISRLMALALKLERLVRDRAVRSYSDLAYAGQVTRARVSQLLRLTELAPAIQEEILFLPATTSGKDVITERALREVAKLVDWEWQTKLFRSLMKDRQHESA